MLVAFRIIDFGYIGSMTGVIPKQGVGGDLLGPHDPLPFSILNPNGGAPAILLCDHASNRVPSALDELGLDEAARLGFRRAIVPASVDAISADIELLRASHVGQAMGHAGLGGSLRAA